jgi:hypothetical protein
MEAAFLATKADIREEIDRLKTHVASARSLLSQGGPVGRKLDFLAQEFNRESNTLCSKSNAAAVTAIGLELEGGGRPVPRAGAESGVGMAEGAHAVDQTARLDAGAVVALRRRQVDHRPQPAGDKDLTASLSVSVTTRERRPARSRAYTTISCRCASSSVCAIATCCSNGRKCTATVTRRRASLRNGDGRGRDMLFDIDWQGAEQLREKIRADIVSVFILPPSMMELKARLQRRAEDADEVIERGWQNARLEIEHWRDYDYVVDQRRSGPRIRRSESNRHRRAHAPRPRPGLVRFRQQSSRRKERS